MKGIWKLAWVQVKLYLREPVGAFFTLLFAPLMLVLFGSIYGNDPVPMFGNRGSVDISVPAYMGLIIATVGLMSVPIATSARREAGVLRRFRATPLRPLGYMLSDIAVYTGMSLLGIVFLITVGKALYDVRFEGRVVDVLLGFGLATFSFLALGYLIAGLSPTARVAQVVGMVVFYPTIFLSGATIPLEVMPQTVRNVARFIPLTYVVKLVRGLWFGEPWGDHWMEAVVLAGVGVVGGIVATKTFRWE